MQQMESTTIINGSLIDSLSVADRGLQYGDGFFTTMLVTGEWLLNWSGHWRRLQQACGRLQFQLLDEQEILGQIKQGVAVFNYTKNSLDTSKVVKVIVTRGLGGQGYQMPPAPQPTIILQISHAPVQITLQPESGLPQFAQAEPIALGVCQTLCAIQPQLAGLKHLNRLENVLARTEIASQGFVEGLMLNPYRQVISGTQSNLFMIKGSELITPQVTDSGVEGTTRYQLSQLADELGLIWQETPLSLDDLQHADELFLANAVRGILPVSQFKQQHLAIDKALQIDQAWSQWQCENALSLSLDAQGGAE